MWDADGSQTASFLQVLAFIDLIALLWELREVLIDERLVSLLKKRAVDLLLVLVLDHAVEGHQLLVIVTRVVDVLQVRNALGVSHLLDEVTAELKHLDWLVQDFTLV